MSETVVTGSEDQDLIAFVVRWAWRDSPITDAERLSAIKYHPTLRRKAIASGYVKAVQEDEPTSPNHMREE